MKSAHQLERQRGCASVHPHVLLLQSWWDDRILRGVADYAKQHRWVLDSSMRWHHQFPPLPWRGDGIIAYCGMNRPNLDLVSLLRKAKCPVVETQEAKVLRHSGQVIVSNEQIGHVGAEHLLRLRFKNLGYVTFEENAMEAARRASFRQTVEKSGATFHALTVENFLSQIKLLPRPMGLMAANDNNAINVILALTEAEWMVPEEYAVLGVDDTEILCELAPVSLSSVNCNYEKQGFEAAALLDRMLKGAPAPREPIMITPKGVTARGSTDGMALSDLDSARFLRFLRNHYLEGYSLGEIAEKLGVSLRKVQVNFQKHLGHTLLDELTRLRVSHAKRLLSDPKLKIETIGIESGFSSRFHFIRAFQRVTGEIPKTYRKNLLQANHSED